jgi:transcriptional regulator with XRE-family HTH domain
MRFLRLSARLSQEELGIKCNIHPTEISRLESGKRNPTLGTIKDLAKGLDVPPEHVVEVASKLDELAEKLAAERAEAAADRSRDDS